MTFPTKFLKFLFFFHGFSMVNPRTWVVEAQPTLTEAVDHMVDVLRKSGARLTSGQSGFPHSWNVAEKTWGKGRIYVDLSKNSKIQRTHNFIPAWGFFWSLQMDGIENSFFLAQKMESPKCCLSLWVGGQCQQRPVLIFPGLLDSCWDAAYHVKSLMSLGTFDICKVTELLAKSMHSS